MIVKMSKFSTGVDIGKISQLCRPPLLLVLFSTGTYELLQRPNSGMKSRQKSKEFSSLLFTVTSTALPLIFLSLQTHATSYIKLEFTVKEKNLIENPPYGLRNPYRNLKSEKSQDYAQKPQRNCRFMNSALVVCCTTTGIQYVQLYMYIARDD